ncbi:hypothetical protein KW805_03150 [Candidatus Pacearchaeota archaeon]|nr:hypothetical protein [Candidatus Pacearchaeota archaeon]
MKRGLSDVVTTVLLLLLTVAAVSLIASFLIPWIKGSLSGSTSCIAYNTYFTFDQSFGYNCYDSAASKYYISVRAEPNSSSAASIQGFDIALLKQGSADVIHVRKEQQGSCTGIGMKNDCASVLKVPEAAELLTYAYSGSAGYESLEIYPVVSGGKVCSQSHSIKLKACTTP